MTEVPEHLLRRARERRAALSGGDAGPDSTPVPTSSPSPEDATAASVSSEVAVAEAATPVLAEAPADTATAVAIAQARRTRVPVWVMPVLAALPFWGILYTGAFGSHEKKKVEDPLVLGQQVYGANCSSCHGASGEGVSGPALKNGAAVKTFKNDADHITWVRTGSQTKAKGTAYGDPNREGGQHKVTSGIMPAFAGQLSDAQIADVVKYERERL